VTIDPRCVREELLASANPERAAKERQYLKSDLEFLGVSVPVIRRVARRLAASLPEGDHDALMTAVASLWGQPIHELRSAGAMLMEARPGWLLATDLPVLESMLREARTWAHVDLLAVHVVGSLAVRFPEVGDTLDRWSTDDDS
jgi:3-methyladenine DNA glycosylase AlkD